MHAFSVVVCLLIFKARKSSPTPDPDAERASAGVAAACELGLTKWRANFVVTHLGHGLSHWMFCTVVCRVLLDALRFQLKN